MLGVAYRQEYEARKQKVLALLNETSSYYRNIGDAERDRAFAQSTGFRQYFLSYMVAGVD